MHVLYRKSGLVVIVSTVLALAFCSEVLRNFRLWGTSDWEIFYFHNFSVYRSLVEFGETPLWNPWCVGGMPLLGNPQTLFPDPLFVLDLAVGPLAAIRLKIVLEYAIGLAGAYWCGRQFALSRLSACYFSGTFLFSTWLPLHLHAGHLSFLCGTLVPWVIGFYQRSCRRWTEAFYGGAVVAVMVFQGGLHLVILTGVLTSLLAACWSIQRRSVRPLATFLILWGSCAGLAAVKLLPVARLALAHPRREAVGPDRKKVSVVGGNGWKDYFSLLHRSGVPSGTVPVPASEQATSTTSAEPPSARNAGPSSRLEPSRWDMPAFLMKIFLGREQEWDKVYYAFQGFAWHEYGAYLGPLAVVLLLGSPFVVFRPAWPWMVTGFGCFLISVGNFAPFAPWRALHLLPVFESMRCPSRFLIPTAFAACMLASLTLDRILRRLWGSQAADGEAAVASRHAWAVRVAYLLVAVALGDSFVVGRDTFRNTFNRIPPPIEPRLPAIVTIQRAPSGQTAAMLANYCDLSADEAIPIPVRVTPRESPAYRGELEFVGDIAPGSGRVELLGWTPGTVRVRVATSVPGWVVLNRNWAEGWTANPPHRAGSHQGRLAAHIEPGTQMIRFVYQPAVVLVGSVVSILTCLGIALALLWSHRSPAATERERAFDVASRPVMDPS